MRTGPGPGSPPTGWGVSYAQDFFGDTTLNTSAQLLQLNVGFLIKESVGYSRTIPFAEASAEIAPDLTVRDLRGEVTLTRTPQGLYAQGKLTGVTLGECSRCLEPMPVTLTGRLGEMYYYPAGTAPADALTIPEDLNLDLAPEVRDDMLLSQPMHVLCRPDCKGLCPTCGVNRNTEPCDCVDDDIDPRLAKLKDLLN